MTRPPPVPRSPAQARQARRIAVVIALTMLAWIAVQVLGRTWGWEGRYALLADLAAMAAFIWALVSTWRLWRGQRPEG
ncbi:DUF5337 family protein [Paracoccus sp. p4-l81]|uniref:DUF5337 family protein n=1 Tax=unclassified Paracoccus (in: a-proteobacteria) TaxID=2688777 RepID=UPI0035B81049